MNRKYFANKLLDFDLSANNGGWQWAASTGCDAQPYFRIFNPTSQAKKFDPEGEFIKKYVPELNNLPSKLIHEPWKTQDLLRSEYKIEYYTRIVDHEEARKKTIELSKQALLLIQDLPTPATELGEIAEYITSRAH